MGKALVFITIGFIHLLHAGRTSEQKECSISKGPWILEIPDYDKRVRPFADDGKVDFVRRFYDGEPTNVTVDLTIIAVTYIDEVNMDYSLDMYFKSHWVDPRLRRNVTSSVLLGYQFNDIIWVPDLFFPNEKAGRSHDMVVPNQYQRLWPNGSVLMSKRISAKFTCYMDIRMYPVDDQACSLQIESYGHTNNELDLFWTADQPVHLSSDVRVTEFTITDVTYIKCDRDLPTGVFPCLRATLYLHRMSGVYLMNAYLPAVLVVIMSWVSFWLHVDAVAARVSIGLLTILTMTTQTTSIVSALPRVAYIKAIEVWMCGCLLFVFVAFLETAAAFVFNGVEKSRSSDKAKGIAALVKDGGMQAFVGQGWANSLEKRYKAPLHQMDHSQRESQYDDSLSGWGSRDLLHDPVSHSRERVSESSSRPALRTIDNVSRVAFPLTFTLFNLVYWVVCYLM